MTRCEQVLPEKLEAMALGPQLTDGTFAFIMVTDNDYSVTQNASTTAQV
jgi:hypothetical protein